MPQGQVRGLSQFYADDLERMEIAIDRRNASPLPYQDNVRIPFRLHVGKEQYDAGLRATARMPVVWVSPDLKDNRGNKVSLAFARVLTENGFIENQKVHLEVSGKLVTLLPF
ncbi:MAG: hypothetical protein M0Z89_01355 [Nitrospiraceae bacterium]|nr:hypothetical protein [Nitrospiraceae bacterium]